MTARTPRLTLLFRSVALLLLATACKVSLNQPATPQAPSLEAANEFVVTPLAASAPQITNAANRDSMRRL